MVLSSPHRRLQRWIRWTGLTQGALAERVGASPTYFSEICTGKKFPGRALANAIKRESTKWPYGPILSEEWDRAEARISRGAE